MNTQTFEKPKLEIAVPIMPAASHDEDRDWREWIDYDVGGALILAKDLTLATKHQWQLKTTEERLTLSLLDDEQIKIVYHEREIPTLYISGNRTVTDRHGCSRAKAVVQAVIQVLS